MFKIAGPPAPTIAARLGFEKLVSSEVSPPRLQQLGDAVIDTLDAVDRFSQPSRVEVLAESGGVGRGIFFALLNGVDRLFRGHGTQGGELSAGEAARVLAAGYDKLDGLDRLILGHLVSNGADLETAPSYNRVLSGVDARSRHRFERVKAEIDALGQDRRARLDILVASVQGVLDFTRPQSLRGADPRAPETRSLLQHRLERSVEETVTRQSPATGPITDDERNGAVEYGMGLFDAFVARETLRIKQADAIQFSEPVRIKSEGGATVALRVDIHGGISNRRRSTLASLAEDANLRVKVVTPNLLREALFGPSNQRSSVSVTPASNNPRFDEFVKRLRTHFSVAGNAQ